MTATTSPARKVLCDAITAHASAVQHLAYAERSLERLEALVEDARTRHAALDTKINGLRIEQARIWAEGTGPLTTLPRSPDLRAMDAERASIADEVVCGTAACDLARGGRDHAVSMLDRAAATLLAACRAVEDEVTVRVTAKILHHEAEAALLRGLLNAASTLRAVSEPMMELRVLSYEPPANVGSLWGSEEQRARWSAFRAALLSDTEAILDAILPE